MKTTQMITTAVLTPDGLQPTTYNALSLADAAHYEPEGVYTVTRTFDRTFCIKFEEHLDRLEESARLNDIEITLDRKRIRQALRQLLLEAGYDESRFRITVPANEPAHVYIAIEPLSPVPEAIRERGVSARTVNTQRTNPAAKSTSWMTVRTPLKNSLPSDIYEGLLVDSQGNILEGLSSNFYAVVGGELRTAKNGVLHGIARQIVLEVAPGIIPVKENPVNLYELAEVQEAFMTSASRGVIPIIQIDDHLIGSGHPGPITRQLSHLYNQWTESYKEPI